MRSLLYSLAVSAFFLFLTTACKGPEGAVGPQGAPGPQGPKGDTGAAGTTGSSNVVQVTYNTKTHDGTRDLFLTMPQAISLAISTELLEKSQLFVYVKQAGTTTSGQAASFWFSIPGETATGNEYSFYLPASEATATTPGLLLRRVVNYRIGAETFDAVRILIVPAGILTNGRLRAEITDYESLRQRFNLPQ